MVEDDHWGGKGVLVDGGESSHLVEGGEDGHDHGGQGGLREGGRTPGMCRMWKENPRQVPLKGENLLLDKLNQQEEITIMFRISVIAMVLHACCLICTSTI